MTAAFRALAALTLVASLGACKSGTLVADRFGSIEGRVLDFQTFAPIGNALVTTSPASTTILTAEDGTFRIDDVLVGTYTLTARRSGFAPATTTISVLDGQTRRADVLLDVESEDEEPTEGEITAQVLNFTNENFGPDSSFVSVEYRATNGGETTISNYDVVFRIDTNRGPFFQQITGASLGPGRSTFGTFRRYLIGATATAVVVESTANRERPTGGSHAVRRTD